MQQNLLQQKCYLHQQDVLAFDLDPLLTELKERYLCLNCLASYSLYHSRQIELIDQAQEKFKKMTLLDYNYKRNLLTQNIAQLEKGKKRIENTLEFLTNKINESIKILNIRILEVENELNTLNEPSTEMKTDQDLINLLNYVNFGFSNNLHQTNPRNYEFIEQIQQLLDHQIFYEELQDIYILLESIQTQSLIEEQVNNIPQNNQQVEENRFRNLRYQCRQHYQKIVLINLTPGQIENRLFCKECTPSQDLDKLYEIQDVNILWQNLIQNIYQSYNNHYSYRQDYLKKVFDEIVHYQKHNQYHIDQIHKLIFQQTNKIIKERNDLQFNLLNKQLNQMKLVEIEQVATILSQHDPMQEDQQQQLQITNEDNQFKNEILAEINSALQILQMLLVSIRENLKFSNELKHQSINIIANGKIATTKTNNRIYAPCLCDQPISQNQYLAIDFKINKLSQIMIGICQSKIINQDYQFYNFNQIGHGIYGLYYSGFVLSDHDQLINGKQLGFKFYQGDIINVSVNQKTRKIIWNNKARKQSYALEFQPSDDLYFCCALYSYGNSISEVQII